MALQAGTTLGQYRIRRLLGEGGMGAVYEAIHVDIERPVAIKVLHPKFATNSEAVRRFFNEARAVNRIEHPSVVQVSEAHHLEDGTAYLVMELLRGESLSERFKRSHGRLPLDELLRIARQVASGLAATHAKGIVHRDLKPDNIMLVSDAEIPGGLRVRLLDFGVAKLLDPGQSASPSAQVLTHPDALIGTPAYMSPEQCSGPTGIDEKTDTYALGVILFEAIAGRAPFVAETNTAIMAMHVFEPPPDLSKLAPETPKVVYELVMRMLSKQKAERPTMAELVTALSEPEVSAVVHMNALGSTALGGGVHVAPAATSGMASTLGDAAGQHRSTPGKQRRLPMVFALLGGAALLLFVLGYLTLHRGRGIPAAVPVSPVVAPVTAPAPAPPAPAPPAPPPAKEPTPTAAAAVSPASDTTTAPASRRSRSKSRTGKKDAGKAGEESQSSAEPKSR